MPNSPNQITPQEQKQVQRIVKSYIMQQTHNNVEKTNQLLGQLAQAIKTDGVKLVHLGENVYIVHVQGPNKVEIDNLSRTPATRNMAKLIGVLSNLGAQQAVFSTREKLDSVLDKLNISFSKVEGKNKEMVYTMEIQ